MVLQAEQVMLFHPEQHIFLVFFIEFILFKFQGTTIIYNSLHAYEYQLCSPFCPLVPLFVRGIRQAVASQDKQKENSLVF
jgi:hypothetical protein